MPSGVSFFTGNAVSVVSSHAKSGGGPLSRIGADGKRTAATGIKIKSESGGGGGGGGGMSSKGGSSSSSSGGENVDSESEDDEELVIRERQLARNVLATKKALAASTPSSSSTAMDLDPSADVDEPAPDENDDDEEEWPPASYDPMAPMLLPFGPRSPQLRASIANKVGRRPWLSGGLPRAWPRGVVLFMAVVVFCSYHCQL